MNTPHFFKILHDSTLLQNEQVSELEDIVKSFPFFQAARVLYLKGLKNKNDFRYNQTLKTTAIHVTDRSVLFDYITSDTFYKPTLETAEQKLIYEIESIDKAVAKKLSKDLQEEPPQILKKEKNKIVGQQKEENKKEYQNLTKESLKKEVAVEPVVSIDFVPEKNICFNKKDVFLFHEWLKLTSLKPIDRGVVSIEDKQEKNTDIIDRFIVNKPKIKPNKSTHFTLDFDIEEGGGDKLMMTETLAQLYIKQRKFNEAIIAYEVLSLKIPEKSGFFADQIKKIKKMKQ